MADHHDYTHYHTPSNDHATDPDLDGHTLLEGEVWETALRELLLEKGVITTPELNDQMNRTASQSAAVGASIIAKAWKDQKFKKAVLANPKATIADLGHDVSTMPDLVIVENRVDVHNVVVCTLCSCYPRYMLGPPPEWYRSAAFRARVVRDPREVLIEFGLNISAKKTIRVYDSTADLRYMVMPLCPPGAEHMPVTQLQTIITRDSMIGVGLPKFP
jgi:hypothetical protein